MQAVLILAHKNFDQVIKLTQLLRPKFEIYMHIDSKSELSDKQRSALAKLNVHYFSKYDVKWGSYSIVRATIDMMKMSLQNPQIEYFHLISGQDWPLQDPQKIYDFFEGNEKIYMNYWRMLDMKKSGEPEIWWVKYYFNYDQINRRTTFGKIYHRFLLLFQTIFHINKLQKYGLNTENMYAGQEWVDIPRNALEYAIKYYQQHPELEKIFSTSFCSDEMWLQTILCNSKFKAKIDKNIHHYIPMTQKHGHGIQPAVLTELDYPKIKTGNYWWGRKVVLPTSSKLIKLLEKKN